MYPAIPGLQNGHREWLLFLLRHPRGSPACPEQARRSGAQRSRGRVPSSSASGGVTEPRPVGKLDHDLRGPTGLPARRQGDGIGAAPAWRCPTCPESPRALRTSLDLMGHETTQEDGSPGARAGRSVDVRQRDRPSHSPPLGPPSISAASLRVTQHPPARRSLPPADNTRARPARWQPAAPARRLRTGSTGRRRGRLPRPPRIRKGRAESRAPWSRLRWRRRDPEPSVGYEGGGAEPSRAEPRGRM